LYLLDELNAYSHDLASATKLVDLHKRDGQVDHRAGLAALMTFLMHYVEVARERKAPTWEGLRRPEVKKVIETLWQQAESTLVGSLGIRGFGGEAYLAHICERRNGEALAELLGRPPMGSAACGTLATAASPTGSIAKERADLSITHITASPQARHASSRAVTAAPARRAGAGTLWHGLSPRQITQVNLPPVC